MYHFSCMLLFILISSMQSNECKFLNSKFSAVDDCTNCFCSYTLVIHWQMLPKLRSIHLRGFEKLIKTSDFRGVPNLERLDLEGCTALLQLHPSIAFLSKLTVLNLRNCFGLVSIPNDLFGLSSLQVLNLAGCSELAKCLNFDPLRSSTEASLLCICFPPFLAKLLSNICICFSPE